MEKNDQLHAPVALPPGKEPSVPTEWGKRDLWDPEMGLDAVKKRKISCFCRESNSNFLVAQSVG
jgi:hypothetical protein